MWKVELFLTYDLYLTIYKEVLHGKEVYLSLPLEQMGLERGENSLELSFIKKGWIWNWEEKLSILMERNDLETLFCQHEHFRLSFGAERQIHVTSNPRSKSKEEFPETSPQQYVLQEKEDTQERELQNTP